MPGDLLKALKAIGTISEAGVFKAASHDAFTAWRPSRLVRFASRGFDALVSLAPGLWRFIGKVQAKMVQNLRRV